MQNLTFDSVKKNYQWSKYWLSFFCFKSVHNKTIQNMSEKYVQYFERKISKKQKTVARLFKWNRVHFLGPLRRRDYSYKYRLCHLPLHTINDAVASLRWSHPGKRRNDFFFTKEIHVRKHSSWRHNHNSTKRIRNELLKLTVSLDFVFRFSQGNRQLCDLDSPCNTLLILISNSLRSNY